MAKSVNSPNPRNRTKSTTPQSPSSRDGVADEANTRTLLAGAQCMPGSRALSLCDACAVPEAEPSSAKFGEGAQSLSPQSRALCCPSCPSSPPGQPHSTMTETISEGLPPSEQPPITTSSAAAQSRKCERQVQGHTDLARRERERLASAISIRSQGPADVTSMSPARDGAPSRGRKGWAAQWWPGGKRAPAPATRSRSNQSIPSVQSRDPPIGCNPAWPMGALLLGWRGGGRGA